MTAPPLKVAVVGHTNTGKTSLMRTLMRDVDFGEVSDRPAVTRAVEAAVLRAGGTTAIELFDTPGLEDSIGLLETLDAIRGERRLDGLDVIRDFLDSADARTRFAQEAKALRQVLESDVALYVVDARDRVHGKHRDELEILGRCAKPIVPVLNFTASAGARTAEWREHLARVNMHAVAEYDTVVFRFRDEERLFEKMRTLLDAHGGMLERLNADRREQRRSLARSSAVLVAELLVDVAALAVPVPADPGGRRAEQIESLRQRVRDREQACVDQLLALHRFRPGDVEGEELPIDDGAWGLDLFSPAAMKQFGFHAGGAAATGAMVGLTFDIMLGGLSLGTGTAAGAAIGGVLGALRAHGRRLFDRARGVTELRCDERTLHLLAARQVELARALLGRGHASMTAVHVDAKSSAQELPKPVMGVLAAAQVRRRWSTLTPEGDAAAADPDRQRAIDELSGAIDAMLRAAD